MINPHHALDSFEDLDIGRANLDNHRDMLWRGDACGVHQLLPDVRLRRLHTGQIRPDHS